MVVLTVATASLSMPQAPGICFTSSVSQLSRYGSLGHSPWHAQKACVHKGALLALAEEASLWVSCGLAIGLRI